jgi:ATP-dependent DNA helicase PIF1
MHELPRKILGEIINQNGTALCNDIKRCEDLLLDRCSDEYKREVFLLVNALKEGIVTDLLNPPQSTSQAALLSRLTQRLHDNLGLDKTLAQWAVQSWAMALGKPTVGRRANSPDARKNNTLSRKKKERGKGEKIEFTEDFVKAYELMENTSRCVFITGKAGTGKSTLLQYFKQNSKKKLVVLAPTGVAALNVGGATLHSFFRLPPRPLHPNEVKPLRSKERRKLYQSIDTIVIDEVSMVRADMMDVIDHFMRLNGKSSFRPFGGAQMIFIGDLFQLPPVVSGDEEGKLFTTTYQSPFFFSALVFEQLDMAFVELTKVYRQKQQEFLYLLNTIRNNQACTSDLQRINQRYQPQFVSDVNDYYITLTTTNKIASQINTAHLEKLPLRQHQFEGEIKGKFDKGTLPTDLVLRLKEGAQVMFVKNDTEGRWVNGTLGRIKKIRKTEISVETPEKEIHTVKQVKWEIPAYQFDENTQKVVTDVIGSFTQYPLRLAWAITIHKSQGKQFDKVIIDLGWGTFAHGQLYVALSRCKTLEGLILKSQVRSKDVIVDERVIDFFASQKQSQLSDAPPF